VFPVIAESIEEKYDFDVVQVNRSHVHKSSVHGDNFISAITKGEARVVAEVESLFQQDQLCLGTKLFMTLVKFIEDEVRCGEVRDSIVVCLGNAFENEALKGAIVCLPDFMSFRVRGCIGLG